MKDTMTHHHIHLWMAIIKKTRNSIIYVHTHTYIHYVYMFIYIMCAYIYIHIYIHTLSSVKSLSHVRILATPWIAARQTSLFITNSQSLLKLIPFDSEMPSSHLIHSHPLLLLPPNPSQHQGLFQWVNSSHEVAKRLEFQLQHQSFQWTPRT